MTNAFAQFGSIRTVRLINPSTEFNSNLVHTRATHNATFHVALATRNFRSGGAKDNNNPHADVATPENRAPSHLRRGSIRICCMCGEPASIIHSSWFQAAERVCVVIVVIPRCRVRAVAATHIALF